MIYDIHIKTNSYFDFSEARETIYELCDGIIKIFGLNFEHQTINFSVNTHYYRDEIETTIYDILSDDFEVRSVSVQETGRS